MTSDTVQSIGWYIAREDGDNDGPLSDAEMRRVIGRGRVKPTDRVWRDGMEEWVDSDETLVLRANTEMIGIP